MCGMPLVEPEALLLPQGHPRPIPMNHRAPRKDATDHPRAIANYLLRLDASVWKLIVGDNSSAFNRNSMGI